MTKNAYRGKHPHRIASVGSTGIRGEVNITANDGESMVVSAKLTGGRMPMPGEEISMYKELSANNGTLFTRNEAGAISGYITLGGCQNAQCRKAIKAGLHFHARPRNQKIDGKLFYATLPSYHFATVEEAREALKNPTLIGADGSAPSATPAPEHNYKPGSVFFKLSPSWREIIKARVNQGLSEDCDVLSWPAASECGKEVIKIAARADELAKEWADVRSEIESTAAHQMRVVCWG